MAAASSSSDDADELRCHRRLLPLPMMTRRRMTLTGLILLLLLLMAVLSPVCHGFTTTIIDGAAVLRHIPHHRVISNTALLPPNNHHHQSKLAATSNNNNNKEPTSPSSKERPSSVEKTDVDWESVGQEVVAFTKECAHSLQLAILPLFQSDDSVTPEDIVLVCDEMDKVGKDGGSKKLPVVDRIRQYALNARRYELLSKLMRKDYNAYVATASFLSPRRISRSDLPNVQDIPYTSFMDEKTDDDPDGNTFLTLDAKSGTPLVPDCELQEMEYQESWLDAILLRTFRKLVTKHTGGVTSDVPGIRGLLEQGRTYMLQPDQTPEAQHAMVYKTLGDLMTPALPPFYRIFMSGIVPEIGSAEENNSSNTTNPWSGKQLGPWFYAPALTSVVTPTFFGFLVGPSRPNRRQDGQWGGLVVEKCKFLQESGCKGLCLNQCKMPAQEFFANELGLPLTVQPNFETQECQWSFGQEPVPVQDDPTFPKGCLVGCESRRAVAAMGGEYRDLCN